jgi:hypothetical protein
MLPGGSPWLPVYPPFMDINARGLRTGYTIKKLTGTPSSICSAHLLTYYVGVVITWFGRSEAAAVLRLECSLCESSEGYDVVSQLLTMHYRVLRLAAAFI